MKRTLVIGASEKPERYAYNVTVMLNEYKHDTYAYGLRAGNIEGNAIQTSWPTEEVFDTVTLYVGPQNQGDYQEKILALHPKRVIFNPGTENAAFETILENVGIEALEACTLVLLRTNQY